MDKTNTNLVEWCKRHLGDYYWFACWCQMCSAKLYEQKKAQNPKYFTANDFAKQIANPKPCTDCSGLIKGFVWAKDMDDTNPKYNAKTDYGATAFYDHANIKGKISSFPKHAGMLVFKGNDKTKSHVGVYIGGDSVIEAKGHKYGVVETIFSKGDWKYWAQSNLITDDTSNPQPAPAPQPQPEPAPQPAPAGDKHSDSLAGVWKVTAKSGLWMRKSPNGEKITCIPLNRIVTCSGDYETADGDDWLKVSYDGMTGFCFKAYLSKIVEGNFSQDYVGTYKVTARSGLWMRSGAGTNHSKITCMSYHSKCTCGGFFEDVSGTRWLKIAQNGRTGWSSSEWLEKI